MVWQSGVNWLLEIKQPKDAMKKKKKEEEEEKKRIFLRLLERLREEGDEDHVRKALSQLCQEESHEGRG